MGGLSENTLSRGTSLATEQIYARSADLSRKSSLYASDLVRMKLEKGESLKPRLAFNVQDCTNVQFATLFLVLKSADEGGDLILDESKVSLKDGSAILLQSKLGNGNVDPRAIYGFTEVTSGNLELLVLKVWEQSQVGCKT